MEIALRKTPLLRIQARTGVFLVILASVFARIFTEQISILPRGFFNLFDLLLVLFLSGYLVLGIIGFSSKVKTGGIGAPLLIYLGALSISTLVNWERVYLKACGTYWLLNLEGILLFMVFMNSNAIDRDFHRRIYHALYYIGMIQPIWIILDGQISRFLSGNADAISGTFGLNPSQLCFVAVWMIAIAISGRTEFGKWKSRVLVGLFVIVYILPQWRAVWPFLPVTFILTRNLLSPRVSLRRAFGVLIKILFIVIAILYGFSLLSEVPEIQNSFLESVANLSTFRYLQNKIMTKDFLKFGKIKSYTDIPGVWLEEKWFVPLIGTGPGTYNSRAYHTFALLDVKGGDKTKALMYNPLSAKSPYRTAISNKFILPIVNNFEVSGTIGSTFGSYPSNIVEIGLVGFFCWMGFYVIMFRQCRRVYQASTDPFYRKMAYIATTLLIFTTEVSFYDDWFSVGRTMVLLWTLFAVVSCEYYKLGQLGRGGEV